MSSNGNAHFCIDCGKEIPQKAKYCPFCGAFNELEKLIETAPEPETEQAFETDLPAVNGNGKLLSEEQNSHYTILDPGADFQGYTIISMLNKDSEGFKYIAQKDGRRFLIKIFFEASFSSMENLYQQQMRLSRISKIDDPHLAKVVEVNLVNNPSYLVTEYVSGNSLLQIKQQNNGQPQEEFISRYIPALIKTAQAARRNGLTINNLALPGMMFDAAGKMFILTSAIKYEEVDEREDVFTIGLIVAQFLASHGLYKSMYSEQRLRSQKFSYINGVSLSLNKLLAECLHRNILQRVTNLNSLAKAFEALPELKDDVVWLIRDRGKLTPDQLEPQLPKPQTKVEFKFALAILGIILVAVLAIFLLFGRKITEAWEPDRVPEADSTEIITSTVITDSLRSSNLSVTGYGQLKQGSSRRPIQENLPLAVQPKTSEPAASRQTPMPASMVFINAESFGFGRLTENGNNVSLSPYYISKYELTQGEWNRFMKPANVSTVGDRLPVDNVSWRAIIEYCNERSESEGLTKVYRISGNSISCDFRANGWRLPTEAEWEQAAKSGQLFNFSGSNTASEVAWFKDNSAGKIRAVGSLNPNAKGLYDMSGNVSEWVWDWFDQDYLRNLNSYINPTGPDSGSLKSIRGGNILLGEGRNLSLLWREKGSPTKGYPFVGVRLARTR